MQTILDKLRYFLFVRHYKIFPYTPAVFPFSQANGDVFIFCFQFNNDRPAFTFAALQSVSVC